MAGAMVLARPIGLGAAFAAVLALAAAAPGNAAENLVLVPVAEVGPWSGISELIGYGDRLWFVNSVKFVNHNSADLYSYGPKTGAVRFERHLFSQDAGQPVVAEGLLYWPFEDPRFSAGRGEYMVTNGRDWQWRALPAARAFHLHAMASLGGRLFAATSAWRAGLQRSGDRGTSWEVLYDHPTEDGTVSRITTLAALDGMLYAGLTAWAQPGIKLLRLDGDSLTTLPGWPAGGSTRALVPWRGQLYAVNLGPAGGALWRTDGERVEHLPAFDDRNLRALAGGTEALWAVSAGEGSGILWHSSDGSAWSQAFEFPDDEPLDIAVYAGAVYVGTKGPGGLGRLWGPPPPAPALAAIAAPPLPPRPTMPAGAEARRGAGLLAEIDGILAEGIADEARTRQTLARLGTLAQSASPGLGEALAERLRGPLPGGSFRMFGGRIEVPADKFVRWYLLRAMALNGGGRVPPKMIGLPFAAKPNRAEKYLETAPGAAFAAAQLDQADAETVAALIARLGANGDPPWLAGDIVGALSALTGRDFGYDAAAWRRWWQERTAAGN